MKARAAIITVVLIIALASVALAQRGRGGRGGGRGGYSGRPARYATMDDFRGGFQFCRVVFRQGNGDGAGWNVDWPRADINLSIRLSELTRTPVTMDQTNEPETLLINLKSPELFHCPFLMMTEPGGAYLDEEESKNLRAYLQKGGFLIVDDFKLPGWRGLPGGGWEPFEENVRRVLPGVKFFDMDPSDPIFHSFFDIASLDDFPQAYTSGKAVFRGVYEDNDPKKRLLMIINYNTDVSQYWEWSGRGFRPFDDTNEAYKLGVNYLIYGLTH